MAQDRTITGTVSSKEDGLPIPGVSVKAVGTKTVVQTGADGKFSIRVASNVTHLELVSIGFETQTVNVSSQSNVVVSLATDSKALSEVVVLGYGTSKALGTTVASVGRVTTEQIKDRPVANVLDGLQGQIAGLQIFTSSGEPSASSSLRLHGNGSLGANSTPLLLIDGIQTQFGALVSLNPNDIASIDVLKDASATSIYGARAANGVVAVTTKKGSAGAGSRIEVFSQYSTSSLTSNTTDVFKKMMNTKQLSDFFVATGQQTQAQINTLLSTYKGDTQWYKTYYKDSAPTYQNGLSVSGGAGRTNYYISFGQFKQKGLAWRSDFERYTLLTNVNTKVTDWFDIGAKVQMGYDKRQTNQYGTNSTNRGLFFLRQPWFSPTDENGVEYPDLIPGGNFYQPKYLAEKNPGEGRNLQLNPSAYLQITPLKGLTLRTQAGVDGYIYDYEGGSLPSHRANAGVGNWTQEYYKDMSKTWTNTIEYKFKLPNTDRHRFTALLGHEYADNTYYYNRGFVNGLTDDRLLFLQGGTSTTREVNTDKYENAFNSFFGRLEYSLDNKYYLEGSVRQDESSRFGVNNKKATFWSVGVMWDLKKENFLKDNRFITGANVKLSTGTSGNSSIGNYTHLATVTNTVSYTGTGWYVGAPGNPNLTWEDQQKTTLGLTLEFAQKVRLRTEIYDRQTTNMLMSVPLPYTTGFNNFNDNVGKLQNRGIDVELNADVYKNASKGAYFTPFISFNYNTDKVKELFQGRNSWIVANTGVAYIVGSRLNFLYPMWAGVNPANGNPQWYQVDPGSADSGAGYTITRNDPNAVSSTFNTAALQQNTGIRRYAPINGGFGFNAGYGDFSLVSNFSFSLGKYLINNDRYFMENPNQFPGFNQSVAVLDYWKQPGDVTTFPRYGVQFMQFDDRLIENASFLRLKYIELGYRLPKSILGKTNGVVKSLGFSVGARNLLTWTGYSGPDPEVDSNLSLGANPNTRQITFGLKVGL
jgi:TonB-linked SusC/RagA family outer membrane protein